MTLRNLALSALLLMTAAWGHAEQYVAGQHYKVLVNTTMARDPEKIEVVEVFWYGCGHCNHFEPTVQAWKKFLQADVDFYQVPAQFSRQWKIHAGLFYLTHALKVNDKVHQAIFDEIHKKRNPLLDKDDQKEFLAKYGVSEEDFDKFDDSFGVRRQLKMADQMVRTWAISGVPAVIVNGKYMVNASSAGGEEKVFDVVNFLIEKERQARKS
ncbi:MAG: thiol:disulfide interchange protein DsbA/DsbL [Gammaproteobacteria bacterium]|nr:thiol:disulfide interchange protein DsbA/DsbL [Gammaproteobacteria bacterium]